LNDTRRVVRSPTHSSDCAAERKAQSEVAIAKNAVEHYKIANRVIVREGFLTFSTEHSKQQRLNIMDFLVLNWPYSLVLCTRR
jgi:hypothetical protein